MNNELIQKYIDGETSSQEKNQIEQHLAQCQKCTHLLNEQRLFAQQIKQAIRQMDDDHIHIPNFEKPEKCSLKSPQKLLKRFIYSASVAAACLLIFWIFKPKHQEFQNNQEVYIVYEIDGEFDANRPISQQDYQIQIINKEPK